MNLAIKTSIKQKQSFSQTVINKIINDIHADFERYGRCSEYIPSPEISNRSPENINEVMIRLNNDAWIVGRKSDQREFYVIIDNTHANLSEVNGKVFNLCVCVCAINFLSLEEVKKLSQAYFGNIFMDWS